MPQLRTKGHTKSQETLAPSQNPVLRSGIASGRELIGRMLQYEAAAQTRGVDLSSGRFEMLTASERQFYRAELIADYIRLSAGNMGNTQCYFDSALAAFAAKICDMAIPSHELIGTYLAAVDLAGKEEKLLEVPAIKDAIQHTMMHVMQACVAEMEKRTHEAEQ